MYRAARFVNFKGILGFCIPSIIWVGVGYPVNANCNGHFPFSQHFRNFQLGGNWNMFCRFVPLENSQKKWKKSKKVGPYSQLQFANRILCSIYTFLVVCTSSRSMVGHCDLPGFTTKWNNFLPSRNSSFAPTEISVFFPKLKVPNVWTCCRAWPANWNKTENGKENCDGEWNFSQGKEAYIAIFLQMTIIRKIRNKVWSKLVDYSPKQDDHKQRTLKHRNKPNRSKSANHK